MLLTSFQEKRLRTTKNGHWRARFAIGVPPSSSGSQKEKWTPFLNWLYNTTKSEIKKPTAILGDIPSGVAALSTSSGQYSTT